MNTLTNQPNKNEQTFVGYFVKGQAPLIYSFYTPRVHTTVSELLRSEIMFVVLSLEGRGSTSHILTRSPQKMIQSRRIKFCFFLNEKVQLCGKFTYVKL